MAVTKIADLVIPEVFGPYMKEKITEKSAFLRSGICSSDPTIAALLGNGGSEITLPFFKPLDSSEEDDVLEEEVSMSVSKITAKAEKTPILARGYGWSATELSRFLSGADPVAAILEYVGSYWAHRYQCVLNSVLKGVFANTNLQSHVIDNSTKALSREAMIKAIYAMGDNFDEIKAIAMHSAVMGQLAILEVLDKYNNPLQNEPYYPTVLGKRIIVDDDLKPDENGVYPVFFFGEGSIAFNEADGLTNVETDRDSAKGTDYLFTRNAFTMHPRGMKWVGEPAKETASNAELATGTNWELVAEPKNVRITMLKTKLEVAGA